MIFNRTEDIKDHYSFRKVSVSDLKSEIIGSGAFGKVYKAKSRTDKNVNVAIKAMPKDDIKDKLAFKDEIEILKKLVSFFFISGSPQRN